MSCGSADVRPALRPTHTDATTLVALPAWPVSFHGSRPGRRSLTKGRAGISLRSRTRRILDRCDALNDVPLIHEWRTVPANQPPAGPRGVLPCNSCSSSDIELSRKDRRRPSIMRKMASLLVATVAIAVWGTGVAFGATHQTQSNSPPSHHSCSRQWLRCGSCHRQCDVITFETHGVFRLSPLGRFTFRVHGTCTNADCSTFNATTIYTAARGTASPPTGARNGDLFTEYVISGTGRLAGASGTMTETGTTVADPSDLLAISGTFKINGTIRTAGHPCRPHR